MKRTLKEGSPDFLYSQKETPSSHPTKGVEKTKWRGALKEGRSRTKEGAIQHVRSPGFVRTTMPKLLFASPIHPSHF